MNKSSRGMVGSPERGHNEFGASAERAIAQSKRPNARWVERTLQPVRKGNGHNDRQCVGESAKSGG